MHSSSTSSGPGSVFALGAAGEGGTCPLPDESHLEAPGLRLLRMSSLHSLGSRTRGSSGSAAADAAHLVPGLSASAAASAAAAASALRSAGELATPVSRSDTQTDPQAALHALAKSRPLRRLERDVAAGAGSMKALKRRARARECAEVRRGSQRGTSSAMTERRPAEEHFGRSAATQAAEEAAELASLGPATLSAPASRRHRVNGAVSAAASSAAASCMVPTIRMSSSVRTPLSAPSSAVTSRLTGAKRGSSIGPTAMGTCGCSALRMRALRNSAALAHSPSLPQAARASRTNPDFSSACGEKK